MVRDEGGALAAAETDVWTGRVADETGNLAALVRLYCLCGGGVLAVAASKKMAAMRGPSSSDVQSGRVMEISERDHMLLRPELMTKSVFAGVAEVVHVCRDGGVQVGDVRYNPGMVHPLVEILSNAVDNASRNGLLRRGVTGDVSVSPARVVVELTPAGMAVENYGAPFDISEMPGLPGTYIPDACFTRMRVGSNFEDDREPRLGVGRNGMGATVATVYSKHLVLTCVDASRRRYFRMEISKNGDPETKVVRVHVEGDPPADIEAEFAGGTRTRVEWVPDFEGGDLDEGARREFLRGCRAGEVLVIRRRGVSGETHEERVPYDGSGDVPGSVVEIRTLEGRKTSDTAMVFRGSAGVSDGDVAVCSRYCYDFALNGVPVVLRRAWADGACDERVLRPMSPKEYGRLLFGEGARSYEFEWESGGTVCAVALFDTPDRGRSVGTVNGLFSDEGIQFRGFFSALTDAIKEREDVAKYAPDLKVTGVRRHFSVVIRCVGPNPKQEGQVKTGLSSIGGKKSLKFKLPEGLMKEVAAKDQWRAMESIKEAGKRAEFAAATSRVSKMKIDGYMPANKTGPASGLILTEGDSCRTYAMIMANLSSMTDHIGVLPLRGVPPNFYGKDPVAALGNAVISSVVKAMGLDFERTYETEEDVATLKYGSVLMLGDPDLDGFHIVGLVLAFFWSFWPGLFHGRRIGALRTPVVRIQKGARTVARYYSDAEFDRAVSSGAAPKGEVKRIKGLGGVDIGVLDRPGAEIRDDFATAPVVWFEMTEDGASAIDAFFSSEGAAMRKHHIARLAPGCHEVAGEHVPSADTNVFRLTRAATERREVESFVAHELVMFSVMSLSRALVDFRDGMKDAVRKLVGWLIEHGGGGTHKVDQLVGRVSEAQDYHHGPQSLGAAAKRLAVAGFTGANNMPLLDTRSNVGSKVDWPRDAAADRYVMVRLAEWVKAAVPRENFLAVPRKVSDGKTVEPEFVPFDVPVALINGARGVCVGWRSHIPPHDPGSVVDWLIERALSDVEGREPLLPDVPVWFSGFKGTIAVVDEEVTVSAPVDSEGDDGDEEAEEPEIVSRGLVARGVYALEPGKGRSPAVLKITEVPPETRLRALHVAIERMIDDGLASSFTHSTRDGIDYRVSMTQKGIEAGEAEVERRLGLVSRYSLKSYTVLSSSGEPVDVGSTSAYLSIFYTHILRCYEAGAAFMVAEEQKARALASAKERYIQACLDGTIVLGKTTKDEMEEILRGLSVPVEITRMSALDLTAAGLDAAKKRTAGHDAKIAEITNSRACERYLKNLLRLRPMVPPARRPVLVGPQTWGPENASS